MRMLHSKSGIRVVAVFFAKGLNINRNNCFQENILKQDLIIY